MKQDNKRMSAAAQPEDASQVAKEQRVRKLRLGMACISYLITFTLVAFLYEEGMLPLAPVIAFVGLSLLINGTFLTIFQLGLNLRCPDPSLTASQIIASAIPPLMIIYYLDVAQARSILLLIAVVPALYGIFALNTRQLMRTLGIMVGFYAVLLLAMRSNRPEAFTATSLEIVQLFALVVVFAQIAWLGGYINHLRSKIKARNQELSSAMGELNTALETIRGLASRDELTGISNRRHLLEMLAHEFKRYQRAQAPFSIAMIDVDHFKQVNDRYGHQAGDQVLRSIAERVQASLRNTDCFGRYGGEEFMVILPQTPLSGARVKAERIRRDVESLRFPDIAPDFHVTVSIGLAEFHDASVDEATRRADALLYRAKQAGRNQVMFCEEIEPGTEGTTATPVSYGTAAV